jgi:PadR family transcriptional regulator PadR
VHTKRQSEEGAGVTTSERLISLLTQERKVAARPRNWLTPLALVILHQERSYGYELMERLATEFEFEQINAGTLYRNLRQMEKEGLCEAEWETSESGPARRMYFITEAGQAYLDAWVRALKDYRRTMDALSQAYENRAAPRASEQGEDDEALSSSS